FSGADRSSREPAELRPADRDSLFRQAPAFDDLAEDFAHPQLVEKTPPPLEAQQGARNVGRQTADQRARHAEPARGLGHAAKPHRDPAVVEIPRLKVALFGAPPLDRMIDQRARLVEKLFAGAQKPRAEFGVFVADETCADPPEVGAKDAVALEGAARKAHVGAEGRPVKIARRGA